MSEGRQETRGKRQEAPETWLARATCYLVFVILAVALIWPVAQHPGWWIWFPGAEHSDLAVTHWPNAHFTRRALWDDGQFPVWRPTIMSGTPLAANPLAGLCYPPNWLFLFLPWLPLEVGFNLSALAHVWLAGAAMYTLMRRGFGADVWGALVAAVAYEASPKLLAHLGAGHVGWVQGWGWLPVVVLCWLEMFRIAPRRSQFAIFAGMALAMQFCADVRMAAYTVLAGCGLVVARGWRQRTQRRNARLWALELGLWGLSLVVFLGLAAYQWLPLVALLPETTRSSMTLRDAAAWSLPWRYLAGLLLADHGGFHEWMTYVGVSTLALAGIGLRVVWRKREERWLGGWLAGLLVGSAWFSLGENGGLFPVLWRVVPGLGLLRVPPRAWVLVVFAAAVLAGFGLEELRRHRGRLERWKRASLLAAGTFPAMLVAGYWLRIGPPPLNLVMFGIVTPLAIALIGFRFQVGPHLKPETLKPETILSLAAVLLVTLDLLAVDGTLIETRSPEEVFAEGQEVAAWLAAQPGRFRVYSPSYSVPQHLAELVGLELVDGVDPLQLHVYADYLTQAAGLEPQGYSVTLPPFPEGDDSRTALQDAVPDAEMLGLLGARYVAAFFPIHHPDLLESGVIDGVHVYVNRAARPVADAENAIGLSDGTNLFEYDPRAVYVGWVVSGVTAASLLAAWVVGLLRRRRGVS
jgi:hypothetical protein